MKEWKFKGTDKESHGEGDLSKQTNLLLCRYHGIWKGYARQPKIKRTHLQKMMIHLWNRSRKVQGTHTFTGYGHKHFVCTINS